MMKIQVIDLILNKSCVQDTKELKTMSESQFIDYLERKTKENTLSYKIL